MRTIRLGLGLAFIVISSPLTALGSIELSFFRVTPANAAVDVAGQFTVSVLTPSDAESTYVDNTGTVIDVTDTHGVFFAFTNSAVNASSISEIYFDDGTIIGAPTIYNSINLLGDATLLSDTSFAQIGMNNANPPDLPGGNNVGFQATQAFSVDAQGNPSNGIDSSEDILGLSFELLPAIDFDDLVDALQSGDLRVGFHVRAIGADSDSFVNNPLPPDPPIDPMGNPDLPEPTSALVWCCLGLSIMTATRRRVR